MKIHCEYYRFEPIRFRPSNLSGQYLKTQYIMSVHYEISFWKRYIIFQPLFFSWLNPGMFHNFSFIVNYLFVIWDWTQFFVLQKNFSNDWIVLKKWNQRQTFVNSRADRFPNRNSLCSLWSRWRTTLFKAVICM